MANLAFLVEGQMEQKIIQKICPGKPVQLIGCNGDDVKIPTLIDFVETKLRLWRGKYYPIVIWVDRENRKQTCDQMANEMLMELEKRGYKDDQFRIAIPDRCSENWILAGDPDLIEYPKKKSLSPVEGTKAKGQIKKQLALENYVEVLDGVKLFLACTAKKIAERSASFRKFKNKAKDLDCSWLNGPPQIAK